MYVDVSSIISSKQAITATAVSTFTYDAAGLGVGQPVANTFGIQDTSFGGDLGGGGPLASGPQLLAQVVTAFTAGGAATLRVQLQAAADTANSGTPGTWDTIMQTDDIAVALLTAGAKLASFTVPDRYLGQAFPRFYRLNYVVTTGPMTAGTMNAFLLTGVDDLPAYPSAY
jgi:hypothetical protein